MRLFRRPKNSDHVQNVCKLEEMFHSKLAMVLYKSHSLIGKPYLAILVMLSMGFQMIRIEVSSDAGTIPF